MRAYARLARRTDDVELRGLLREQSVGETLALSYEREPDFFVNAAARTLSVFAGGALSGMVSRSLRKAYVNGRKAEVGMLNQLRIRPNENALAVLAAGAGGLRRLHRDHRAPYYLATLVSAEARSSRLLQSGRLGLPAPYFRDKLLTLSFATRKAPLPPAGLPPWSVLRAFLATQMKNFQFSPSHDSEPKDGREWVMLKGAGGIRGLAAILDERAFKQIRVAKLPAIWKQLRPAYNALMPTLRRWSALPAEGEKLESASLCCFCAVDLDSASRLLDAALALADKRGLKALNLCLSEGHPMLQGLRRLGGLSVESQLALLHWADGVGAIGRLDSRPAFIDASDL